MPYNQESFTFTSGATGSFSYYGGFGGPIQPAFTTGPGALMGTFNGQQITGFSNYGNPVNAVLGPGDGNPFNRPNVNGIFGYRADPDNQGQQNGVSFNLADGSSVHISVYDIDGLGHYQLQYITTTGASGTLQVSHTEAFGVDVPCFAAGTLIRTHAGEASVEALREGDLVSTATGAFRPVRWTGHSIVHPLRTPVPRNAHPVRIRAHAFAEGLPARDLIVSPGHALLVGEVLINAGELVNGGTIVQEERARVDYYHVELDSHDILIAEGMPCESYLDDGNRASFIGGADHVTLHGRIDRETEETCRPLVKSGPLLIAARKMLLARAIELGWTQAEQPDLQIVVADAAIEPVAVSGKRYWFALPGEGATTLRLSSAAAIVNRIAPELADDRRLGVALGALKVNGAPVDLASASLGAGFYPLEDDGCSIWRWMNGEATLAFDTPARMVELDLQIVMPCLHRTPGASVAREALSAAG